MRIQKRNEENVNHFNKVRMKLLEDVHQNGALIIYGTQINSLADQNKNAALELLQNYFWKGSKVIADTSINDKQLKSNSIITFRKL